MFAQRGTYGWGGNWPGDAYQVCLWAGLQPDIVFDETIVQEGLDRFKVLIMPDCDVLTDSVAKRIIAFQQRGGVVVGDDRTAPAVKCDITMSPFDRTGHAERDKAALQAIAARLRESLTGRYDRYADSSNPDVIPYRRRHGGTDYLFVVNDHREYGRYVGHHGRVMENGLPSQATLSVARDKGHVYDLVGHSEVATRQEGGPLKFDVALGPSEGGLYMLVARAIEGLQLEAPDSARRGDQVVLEASVVDGGGQPVDAVVPLLVTVEDAEGRQAEFSGYWAAVGGRAKITLDIAANDPAGTWTIAVTELASGRNARRYVRVLDDAAPTGDLPLNKDTANPVQPKG